MKKFLSAAAAAAVTFASLPLIPVNAVDPASKEVDALQYTYEIIPLMEPFNEYFFVKTDNPHPESFRFSDKDSPYSATSVIYNNDSVYADVKYEDAEIRRVNGGYIFRSFTTNGGEVTLQVHQPITKQEFNIEIYGTPEPEQTGYSPYHGMPVDTYKKYHESGWSYSITGYFRWVDTDVTITLPELCDDCDYLINTYATADSFFENMDAVQTGFSKDCLYSGSYIRGELYKSSSRDWHLSPAGHLDQSFYIYSPYDRKDNKYLLASSLYPFRYDSLGFPGMMGSVSKRLSPDSSYSWSDNSHAFISVTYDGETKTYGGAGNGEGQGLSEDKITRMFTFGDNDERITLEESRKLLDDYAAVEMEDDIPREDALTWEMIYDTVGDGAWVDMGGTYAYLYQKNDARSFTADEWGVGYSNYWWGSLGYCSDTWVDGRYVNKAEYVSKGAKLEDHPTSNIFLSEAEVPVIAKYNKKWNGDKQAYEYVSAEVTLEKKKNVTYKYDEKSGCWKIDISWNSYNTFSDYQALADAGLMDEAYLDMLVITPEEAEAMILDRNTDTPPENGYYFDGISPAGTPFFRGDANDDGEVTVADAVMLQKWLLSGEELTNWRNADLYADRKIDAFDMVMLRKLLTKSVDKAN